LRVLYASHTYLIGENQKKLAAIVEQSGVELAVVVPHLWKEPVLGTIYPHIDVDSPYKIFPTRIVLPGNEMRFMYLSLDLHMQYFRPDVIVVENGVGALSYTQFLLCKRKFAPQAKVVFFTWWNIQYRTRQPFRAIESFNIACTDGAIVGNSEAEIILRGQGYTGPLTILPQLGVDTDLFSGGDGKEVRERLGLNQFVIGYAGRLVPEKGLRVLMDALSSFKGQFDLLIVGSGEMENELRVWASTLPKGKNLHLHKSVPHAQIPELMQAMDVFVLPSLTTPQWKEQFGHVLIEAMACEVAVIGSNSAEIPNVIGPDGIVVPEGDSKRLCAALQQLADNAPKRIDLANKGRLRVLDKYTNEKIASHTLEFIRQLLSI
jgi:glycosyltransferase involved in cell wall biosynthesis